MNKLSRELLIEQLIMTCGVSREDVLLYLKNCSFSQYVKLHEATADRNPWLTSGTTNNGIPKKPTSSVPSNPATTQEPLVSQQPINKPADGNVAKMADEFSPGEGLRDRSGKQYTFVKDAEGDFYDVVDVDGKPQRVRKTEVIRTPSTYTKVKNAIKGAVNDQDFNSGRNFMRQYMEDIERLKELSGISEVSVIGNTADSHKPTVQLRKEERIKRDKRERKRENKHYTPEPAVKREVPSSVINNIRNDLKK